MNADRPHLLLYAEAVLRIERRARMSPLRETGGLLLGFRVADDVHAVDAVEVRDRAASPNRYLLRKRLADKALSDYLAGLPEDSAVGYVGLWHTHPACVGPSLTDRLTLRREAAGLTDSVALLVFARCGDAWKPHAYVSVQRGRRRIAPAEVDYPSASSGNGSPVGGGNDRST